MRVLVACEESQVVTKTFRARGHEAWSCDIIPCSGGKPEWHIQEDVLRIMTGERWDMVLAFTPCTHLAVSGARYFKQKQKDGRQDAAVAFFMKLALLGTIPKRCIENPVGIMSTRWRKPDQIIHPYMFGHSVSKKTCLWLEGLPMLRTAQMISPESVDANGNPRWGNQTPSGCDRTTPGPHRAQQRSRTYEGIASAMAAQWG